MMVDEKPGGKAAFAAKLRLSTIKWRRLIGCEIGF